MATIAPYAARIAGQQRTNAPCIAGCETLTRAKALQPFNCLVSSRTFSNPNLAPKGESTQRRMDEHRPRHTVSVGIKIDILCACPSVLFGENQPVSSERSLDFLDFVGGTAVE